MSAPGAPAWPTITVFYAAPLLVFAIVLASRVSLHRLRHRIGLGDGGDRALARKIRVHGNLVEVAPLGILALLLAELMAAPPPLLHGCGAALVIGRVLHALGLGASSGSSFGRFAGSTLSWLAVVVAAIAAFLRALG
jgi:hypothetical protein